MIAAAIKLRVPVRRVGPGGGVEVWTPGAQRRGGGAGEVLCVASGWPHSDRRVRGRPGRLQTQDQLRGWRGIQQGA